MKPVTVYLVLVIGLLLALALAFSAAWTAPSLLLMILLMGVLAYLALKVEAARIKLNELGRWRNAYDQLDAQAKLIIRTDLELHRTQAELDRQLTSLVSLHRFGRQLEVGLRPEEVYGKLDEIVVTNVGFAKGLLGMCASLETLEWRSLVRVAPSTANELTTSLLAGGLLAELLTKPGPLVLNAATAAEGGRRKVLELLEVPAAILIGVMPHTGPGGCLLLGLERVGTASDTRADEELVSILANQLAIAVENSALYEKSWTSQEELERKVRQRTHELADANAELVRLNKAKSEFVSAVSHELRTPLAAIKGYAALLGGGQFGPLAPPQAERIAKVEKHADLLTQLINNLLDIARIESGHVTMERRPIPVKEFLSSIQDVVQPQLEAKRLRFSVDSDGVTQLVGDPQHLQRVFVNLLSNAIKYTPEGGAIRLGLKREASAILASVADTGCGIAPEELPKLFHEFYRANDPINQQIRGTGLGLALVKRIVEAHQGRVWVTSEKGNGSTFSVSLPADL